jgi:hypothetical protein
MTILFFVVYAGFIGWMSIVIAPALYRLSGARIAARNPDWLRGRPALAERLRRRSIPVWLSRAAGAALLVGLAFAALAAKPLEAMTEVFIGSVVVLTLFALFEAFSNWRLTRLVPAPPKREANLLSTRYEEHALTPFGVAWYVALAAALGLYAYAYVEGLVPSGQAAARMVGIGIIVVLSAFAYRQSRRQPAQPGQRKFGIAVMSFCLLVVLGRIAQDFFGAPQVDEIWFFFFFALAMQAVFAVSTVKAVRQARAARGSCAPAP